MMDLEEIGWGGEDWTGLAQDRYRWRALVNAAMNLGARIWAYDRVSYVLCCLL
jgi:hypothetical protein